MTFFFNHTAFAGIASSQADTDHRTTTGGAPHSRRFGFDSVGVLGEVSPSNTWGTPTGSPVSFAARLDTSHFSNGLESITPSDIFPLGDAEIVTRASSSPTPGWVLSFTLKEEKISGNWRRLIACPRSKNRRNDCRAEVPLLSYVSPYLPAVLEGYVSLFDLKGSFFQLALPLAAQSAFRFRDHSGDLFQLNRPPMGFKASPEIGPCWRSHWNQGASRSPSWTYSSRLDRQYTLVWCWKSGS